MVLLMEKDMCGCQAYVTTMLISHSRPKYPKNLRPQRPALGLVIMNGMLVTVFRLIANACLLPPVNKVWSKVIVSRASVCPRRGRGDLPDRDPTLYGQERAVRILLECILV